MHAQKISIPLYLVTQRKSISPTPGKRRAYTQLRWNLLLDNITVYISIKSIPNSSSWSFFSYLIKPP